MLLEMDLETEFFLKLTHDQRKVIPTVVQITRQGFASTLANGVGFDVKGRMK